MGSLFLLLIRTCFISVVSLQKLVIEMGSVNKSKGLLKQKTRGRTGMSLTSVVLRMG